MKELGTIARGHGWQHRMDGSIAWMAHVSVCGSPWKWWVPCPRFRWSSWKWWVPCPRFRWSSWNIPHQAHARPTRERETETNPLRTTNTHKTETNSTSRTTTPRTPSKHYIQPTARTNNDRSSMADSKQQTQTQRKWAKVVSCKT